MIQASRRFQQSYVFVVSVEIKMGPKFHDYLTEYGNIDIRNSKLFIAL